MTRGRWSIVVTLSVLCAAPATAQSIAVNDTSGVREAAEPYVPPAPPRFAHDQFFLDYTAAFASYGYRLEGNYPGPLGMTGDALAYGLPGIGYKSSGAHHEPGAFNWFGGDGTAVGFSADRSTTGTELLGYPPSGEIDPVTLAPFADSLYLLTAPLLSNTPATVASWRDPTLPDSTQAIARHTNGPDGFTHTGGRFRADIGHGWEFDGTGFRTFSDGQQTSTPYDGHSLDIELRRTMSGYPTRLRFMQNRGNRFEAFRWQPDTRRAHLFYVVSDLRFEIARPDSAGEWLFGLALRHDDQKLDTALLARNRTWYSRSYTASLSRLWQGRVASWLAASGTQQTFGDASGLPDQRQAELSGGLWRQSGRLNLSATGAVSTHSSYDFLWRAAAAVSLRIGTRDHVTLTGGRSVSAPAAIRRAFPQWSAQFTLAQPTVDTAESIHQTLSLAWNHHSQRLQFTILASTGKSQDIMTWRPAELGWGPNSEFIADPREHRFAGIAALAKWQPIDILRLSGGVDQTVTNEDENGSIPSFAPDTRWWAEAAFPMYVDQYNLHFTPLISTFGAAKGTLPEDYGVLNIGWDFRVKQLTIFWRYNNLLDLDYQTGGAGYALDRHYMYGIRWEFWN